MFSRGDEQESGSTPRWTEHERARYAMQVEGARKAAGMTQQEVADAAGVSRGTIANIERGERVPQAGVLWRVLVALDIAPGAEPQWSEEVQGWLMIIGPLLEQMSHAARERSMLQAVRLLGDALRHDDGAPSPSATVHVLPSREEPVTAEDETDDGLPFGAVAHRKDMTAEEEENRMLGFSSGEWDPS